MHTPTACLAVLKEHQQPMQSKANLCALFPWPM